MNFKPGQRVVCIESVSWFVGVGPKKDEVVTVLEPGVDTFAGPMLSFVEYGEDNVYQPKYFRPLDTVQELIGGFKEVLETADGFGLGVRWGLKALNFRYRTNEKRKHKCLFKHGSPTCGKPVLYAVDSRCLLWQ